MNGWINWSSGYGSTYLLHIGVPFALAFLLVPVLLGRRRRNRPTCRQCRARLDRAAMCDRCACAACGAEFSDAGPPRPARRIAWLPTIAFLAVGWLAVDALHGWWLGHILFRPVARLSDADLIDRMKLRWGEEPFDEFTMRWRAGTIDHRAALRRLDRLFLANDLTTSPAVERWCALLLLATAQNPDVRKGLPAHAIGVAHTARAVRVPEGVGSTVLEAVSIEVLPPRIETEGQLACTVFILRATIDGAEVPVLSSLGERTLPIAIQEPENSVILTAVPQGKTTVQLELEWWVQPRLDVERRHGQPRERWPKPLAILRETLDVTIP
jgi:hypothetical protein